MSLGEDLKKDLIKAKVEAAKAAGYENLDTSEGSYIERDAEFTKKAIVNFMTNADMTITKFACKQVGETLNTPSLPIDLKIETLLGDKKPMLDALKKIGSKIPGAGKAIDGIVNKLEGALAKAIQPLLKAAGKVPGINLAKGIGGLKQTGYSFIGKDPDTQEGFDVSTPEGQREHTSVRLFKEDVE